jgi:hypothetical protein
MESVVFNDLEVWRFQGKTNILAVEIGFGDILQQYKGKTGFKITSFHKNRFTNFGFESYKNSSKYGTDSTAEWQTADGLKC